MRILSLKPLGIPYFIRKKDKAPTIDPLGFLMPQGDKRSPLSCYPIAHAQIRFEGGMDPLIHP